MISARYIIADLPVELRLPSGSDPALLLPNFEPFKADAEPSEPPALIIDASEASPVRHGVECERKARNETPEAQLLDDHTNDLGRVRIYRLSEGFLLTVQNHPDLPVHRLRASEDFAHCRAELQWDSPDAGRTLSAMTRIAFAQRCLAFDRLSVHASAVVSAGRSHAFLGASGTGKSTHARLWIDNIPDTSLLNDDNPCLRLNGDGSVTAYGTPWSGKTACYRNLSAPLASITRLSQAPANQLTELTDVDAFVALLPSVLLVKADAALHARATDLLTRLASSPSVAIRFLRCLPTPAAALLSAAFQRPEQ